MSTSEVTGDGTSFEGGLAQIGAELDNLVDDVAISYSLTRKGKNALDRYKQLVETCRYPPTPW